MVEWFKMFAMMHGKKLFSSVCARLLLRVLVIEQESSSCYGLRSVCLYSQTNFHKCAS